MLLALVALVAGIVVLAVAADQFVVGAARLARILRVAPVTVGVVIVGFGTSAPELLVSAFAAADGELQIAAGNIVGSNLVNLTLILGTGALITTMRVASSTVRREAPLALVAALLYGLLVQGSVERWHGLLLLVVFGGFMIITLRAGREADPLGTELDDLVEPATHRRAPEIVRTALGLVGTLVGAQVLLSGAIRLTDEIGLSEGFVGVTLVAVGTSLPEFVTAIQSARRREVDLVVGNLLGSNIFNALAVGGIAALIGPGRVDDASLTVTGMVLVVAVSLVVWVFMTTGRRVSRAEGGLLIVAYAASLVVIRV